MKKFNENFLPKRDKDSLKKLHYKLLKLIEDGDFKIVNEFLKNFNNSNDIGELRMILVTLKAFKDNPEIKDSLDDISKLLQGKINIPLH